MPMSLDEAYAQANQAYADAEVIPQQMPPDGTYTAELEKVIDRVVRRQDGSEGVLVTAIARIVDGDEQLVGRRFRLGTFSANNAGMLKQLVEAITGRCTSDMRGDVQRLRNHCGTVFVVNISRRTTQRGEFVNANVESVIETHTQTAE